MTVWRRAAIIYSATAKLVKQSVHPELTDLECFMLYLAITQYLEIKVSITDMLLIGRIIHILTNTG